MERQFSIGYFDPSYLRRFRCGVVEEKNDRTLAEVADELDARLKVRVSRSTVQRVVDRLGLTRKKKRSARASRIGPMFGKSVRPSSRRASR